MWTNFATAVLLFPSWITNAMYLIQLILPLHDNDKSPFPREEFESLHNELTHNFGGVTAFLGSPAVGLWKGDSNEVTRDDVVMFEVMVEQLDRRWWAHYRGMLEAKFRQEEVVIRAIAAEKL
jgi:hypothetical protein